MKIKSLFLVSVMTLSFSALSSVAKLPKLNVIKQTKLSNPYSCNGSYKKSAVFLSSYSKDMGAPDLLYNGACNSDPNTIGASTAGDNFTLIADLGEVELSNVTASRAFNLENTVGMDNTFKKHVEVKLGHTYAVLSSKSDIRSLVIYKVVGHTLDGELILDYAVKSYSIQESVQESEGFDWKAENVNNSEHSQ